MHAAQGSGLSHRALEQGRELGMGSPWHGFTGCEKEKLQMHIVPPRAQPLLSPLAAPTTQKALPKHRAPSRGFMQPQFPSRGVERKLTLCVSPFPLGFRVQREGSGASPVPGRSLGMCEAPAEPRGEGRKTQQGAGRGAASSRRGGRTPAHK